MTCLQTLPGREFEVAEKLREGCERKLGEDPDNFRYVLMKGFGIFDIILLYKASSFDFSLTDLGPIRNISKSNEFLCFTYTNNNKDQPLENLFNSNFLGFNLLKIDPYLQYQSNTFLEEYFQSSLLAPADSVTWYPLFTLGWHEIILLIQSEHIDKILNDLLRVGSTSLKDGRTRKLLFLKDFSFLGVNYRILPSKNEILKGSEHIYESLVKNEPSLQHTIPDTINVEINVSAFPTGIRRMRSHWGKNGFTFQRLLGTNNCTVAPQKATNWAHLISQILFFRSKFSQEILHTQTSFRIEALDVPATHSKKFGFFADFEMQSLRSLFSERYAHSFAQDLYSFNSLVQNPILGFSFLDMHKYISYIFKTATRAKKYDRDTSLFIENSSFYLRQGSEIRLYGTYETIDGFSHLFSKIRGGSQRSLTAIELLPSFIIEKRFSNLWQGFIVSRGFKFYHFDTIIIVPEYVLWNPKYWWAIYHEIGHIMINNYPGWLNKDLPIVKQFLADKTDLESRMNTLEEIFAEVIGFEIGFYDNFELYMKKLWGYLKEIWFLQPYITTESYIIRTFFVYLYTKYFKSAEFTEAEMADGNFIFRKLINHIELIAELSGLDFSEKKKFIAAKNVPLFMELHNFGQHIRDRISEDLEVSPESDRRSKNTNSVLKEILNKKIWTQEIESPEAVIYRILADDVKDFDVSIALILSFWNCQMRRLFRDVFG
jgi:hypothetical protein